MNSQLMRTQLQLLKPLLHPHGEHKMRLVQLNTVKVTTIHAATHKLLGKTTYEHNKGYHNPCLRRYIFF